MRKKERGQRDHRIAACKVIVAQNQVPWWSAPSCHGAAKYAIQSELLTQKCIAMIMNFGIFYKRKMLDQSSAATR